MPQLPTVPSQGKGEAMEVGTCSPTGSEGATGQEAQGEESPHSADVPRE